MTERDKKDTADQILAYDKCQVWFNPQVLGVVVPSHLASQTSVCIEVGWNLPVPIPDLRVDIRGVFGTLQFPWGTYTCYIPWDAVYMLADSWSMGRSWTEDMPPKAQAVQDRTVGEAAPPAAGGGKVISLADWKARRGRGRPSPGPKAS